MARYKQPPLAVSNSKYHIQPEKTRFTACEQIIGAPACMSPEQAEMSGLDVDTRSDIHSPGVLLYELLTVKTPFNREELPKSGLNEMRRIGGLAASHWMISGPFLAEFSRLRRVQLQPSK